MPACSTASTSGESKVKLQSIQHTQQRDTAGVTHKQNMLPDCSSACSNPCIVLVLCPSSSEQKPQQDYDRSALSAYVPVDNLVQQHHSGHKVLLPQEGHDVQQQPIQMPAPCCEQPGRAAGSQHQPQQPAGTAFACVHIQREERLQGTQQALQAQHSSTPQLCGVAHETLHQTAGQCKHKHQLKGQQHTGHRQRFLSLLAFLLLGALPLGSLPGAQGQQISCPCWPSPNSQGGCDSSHTLTYTSSSSLPGISVSLCMPLPQYDSRWAALVLHVCWNTSCLPDAMAGSVLTTSLPPFSTGLSSIPAGTYLLQQVSPPQSGINAIAAAFTYTTNTSSTDVSSGSAVTVPSSHLTSINATWVWPSTLTTGNWAQTIIQSLDAVSVNGPAPSTTVSAADTTCSDVLQPSGDPLNPAECADGLIPLYVWSKADDFSDLKYASYPMTHITNTTNMTRCIAPPAYDPYSQQLLWNLTWCTVCYPDGMATPMLISLNATGLPGMDYMPANSTMQLTTRSDLYQFTNSIGMSVVEALLAMGSQDKHEASVVTTLTAPSTTVFMTPGAGVNNVSLGALLTGRITTVANGSLLFFMNRYPYTLEDVDSIRLDYQTLDWSATLRVAGIQSAATLSGLNSCLGAQGSITPSGWQLTLPVLLRDYSIVWDCTDSSLEDLLDSVAGSVGLSRSFISASCEMLTPGGAASVLTSGSSPASVSLSAPNSSTTGRRRLSQRPSSWWWQRWQPHIRNSIDDSDGSASQLDSMLPAGSSGGGISGRRLLQSNTTTTNTTSNTTSPAPAPSPTANTTTMTNSNSTLTDNGGLCGDARILVSITYTVLLNDSVLAQLAAGVNVALKPLLVAAQSQFMAGAGYALSDYDGNLYCTSSLSINTLALMKGGNVGAQDYDLTAALCQSSAQQAVTIIQAMTSGYGLQVSLQPNSVTCVGDYICVDCWPYSIPQWAIILMTCAAMLAVVVLLAIRLKIVKRMEARQRVPAGQLDVERNVKQVQQVQLEEKEAEARLAAEGEMEEEGQEELIPAH